MESFFNFFSANRSGIFIFILCLIVLGILAQWLAWIFSFGRFGRLPDSSKNQNLRYIFSEAAVKIINDFRHLLALIIIVIFALVLGFVLFITRDSLTNMKDALQAVAATLGGLVGSIIGYYFGESAAASAQNQSVPAVTPGSQNPQPVVQNEPEPISPAPPPPPKG